MPNLQRFGSALRLRWLWQSWQEPNRPWRAFPIDTDPKDQFLFARATQVTIGNGQSASFWKCSWLGPTPLCSSYPALFKHSRRKNGIVAPALLNEQWIRDLQHGNTLEIENEFLQLWRRIQTPGVVIHEELSGQIRWTAGGGNAYTTLATYRFKFHQSPTTTGFKSIIWKSWAPDNVKLFAWAAAPQQIMGQ